MKGRQSDFDWLVEKLRIITNFSHGIEADGLTTNYKSHTALKLITVHYLSDVFTKVARASGRKIQGFHGAVYVDLFAGTGLVETRSTRDVVAGSALCAINSGKGFDYSILVEKNGERYNILTDRMAKALHKSQFRIILGDSNEVINDVIETIEEKFENPIVLVFVDPEGLEIKFKTLKALSDKFRSCDFLINVNSPGARRVVGQTEHGIPNRERTLEAYLEDDLRTILLEVAEGKPLEKKYAEQVNKILGKQIGTIVPIRDDSGQIVYNLLYYTRQTRGGSKYSSAATTLKKRIENLNGSDVRRALDQLHGRSTTLNDYSW